MSDARADRLEINGARLHVESAGAGAPIVLVHAGVCDSRMWDPQVSDLAADHRVIRYDLRGYGRSTMPSAPFAHHEDLAALLERLAIGPAVVIGASYGGEVAVALALEYPERVRALVLANTLAGITEPSAALREGWRAVAAALDRGDLQGAIERETRMWVDGPRRSPAEVDPGVRERVTLMNAAIFARADEHEAAEEREPDPPVAERLAAIGVPTCVITGALDQPDALESARRLVATIPGARETTIPDAAHLPSMERPEAFNRLVREFLATLAPPGAGPARL